MISFLKKNSGYSLVEVMVGMVGLSIVVLLLATVVQTSIRTSSTAREGDYALTAAKAKLNELTTSGIPSEGQLNQELRDTFPVNKREFIRKWHITADDGIKTKTPMLVKVTAWTADGSGDPVTVSGYIDPSSLCDTSQKISNIPVVKNSSSGEDIPLSGSNVVEHTIELAASDFTGSTISNKNIPEKLLSVSPHPDDRNVAKKLSLTTDGSSAGKVVKSKDERSILIDTGSIFSVSENDVLEFKLSYQNCDEKDNGKVLTVKVKFEKISDDAQSGGLPFINAVINETCVPGGGVSIDTEEIEYKEKGEITITEITPPESIDADLFPFEIKNGKIELKSDDVFKKLVDYEKTREYLFYYKVGEKTGEGKITVKNVDEPIGDTLDFKQIPSSSFTKSETNGEISFTATLKSTQTNIPQYTNVAYIRIEDPDYGANGYDYEQYLEFVKYNISVIENEFISDNFEVAGAAKDREKPLRVKNSASLSANADGTPKTYNLTIKVIEAKIPHCSQIVAEISKSIKVIVEKESGGGNNPPGPPFH